MNKTRSELSRAHDRSVYYINDDLEAELIADLPNMEIREIKEEARKKIPIIKDSFKKFLTRESRLDILERIENLTDEEFLIKYHPYFIYLPND